MNNFPKMADGRTLGAMKVSLSPERFVYGDPDVLAWLRAELEKKDSSGMPPKRVRWV